MPTDTRADVSELHETPSNPPSEARSDAERAALGTAESDHVDAPRRRIHGNDPLTLLLKVLSSFGLSVVLLLLLGALTYFGTISQTHLGIHGAQDRYFFSWWLVEWIGGVVPLPLPGGYPVMGLLVLNLVVGGILRMRWDLKRAGILITHFGILFLFVSGFVKDLFAYEGHLTLYEGEKAAYFESWNEWDVVVSEQLPSGKWKETIVRGELFEDLARGGQRTFRLPELPFDVRLSDYYRNSTVRLADVNEPGGVRGFMLLPRPVHPKIESNISGVHATILDKKAKTERKEILFGFHDPVSVRGWRPARIESDGKTYAIDLRRRHYPLPFPVELEDFRRELHPGTGMAASFESDVIVETGGVKKEVTIWMNHPLRREGFVFFQSNWGPQGGGPGPMYSTFSVVSNPTDHWPLFSCIIIAFGLLLHFGFILFRYIEKEAGWNA